VYFLTETEKHLLKSRKANSSPYANFLMILAFFNDAIHQKILATFCYGNNYDEICEKYFQGNYVERFQWSEMLSERKLGVENCENVDKLD
jgi:hypothetical protein